MANLNLKIKEPWKFVRHWLTVIVVFFLIGLSIGACSLGLQVPLALWNMWT